MQGLPMMKRNTGNMKNTQLVHRHRLVNTDDKQEPTGYRGAKWANIVQVNSSFTSTASCYLLSICICMFSVICVRYYRTDISVQTP